MVCAQTFLLQNCHPRVRTAHISPISHCRGFSVPRSRLVARPSSQAPWAVSCTDLKQRVALDGIEHGTSRSCCTNLYAHITKVSAQIAEWHVHKDICGTCEPARAGPSAHLRQVTCPPDCGVPVRPPGRARSHGGGGAGACSVGTKLEARGARGGRVQALSPIAPVLRKGGSCDDPKLLGG